MLFSFLLITGRMATRRKKEAQLPVVSPPLRIRNETSSAFFSFRIALHHTMTVIPLSPACPKAKVQELCLFGILSFLPSSPAPDTSGGILIKNATSISSFVRFIHYIIIKFFCQSTYSSLLTEISYAVLFSILDLWEFLCLLFCFMVLILDFVIGL